MKGDSFDIISSMNINYSVKYGGEKYLDMYLYFNLKETLIEISSKK